MFNSFIRRGVNLVIDEVGINKHMRNRYIRVARQFNYKIIVIVMPKLTMKESVDRRMQDPHGQPDRNIWEGVWKKFDKMYEKPSKKEGINEIIYLKETKPPLEMNCPKCGGHGKVLK